MHLKGGIICQLYFITHCRLCTEHHTLLATTIVRRLEWAGQLVRMSGDRTVKKAFLGKPDGIRKAVRPKLRWLHSTENDLKSTEEESRRHICMGYHSEAGTGYTTHTNCQKRRYFITYRGL
jgi:hypothetical protein